MITPSSVIAGLDPAIHDELERFVVFRKDLTCEAASWMRGS
ncbi:MAG: hypothetical protein OJF62_002277 [Pseudolabrys sp.]|nr:hypothetical protein [Pseudolabrys sp.]